MNEHSKFYKLSKQKVLTNAELAEWIRELEDKILSQSHSVTASSRGRPR